MTKSSDACEDFIGRLSPDEWPRSFVRDLKVPPDGCLQFARAAVHATSQLLVGERREPALDQIDPRGTRRGEVHVVSPMAHEPAVDERRLVGAVVVENHVHIERRRHGPLDCVEEPAKFRRAVPVVKLADDLARLDVQRGEERGRAMARVVVGPARHLSGPHRQQRLRAIQGLNLGFLVDAQDQRLVRRVEVEPYDVAAVNAVRGSGKWRTIYLRKKAQGKTAKQALVVVAVKLLHAVYAMLKHRQPYNPSRLLVAPATMGS